MEKRYCAVCGVLFYVLPQCPNQMYCSDRRCQQARKNLWQRSARQDPDYKENQSRAQERWCTSHPDYWRNYRAEHAEYTQENRERQAARNAKRGKKT